MHDTQGALCFGMHRRQVGWASSMAAGTDQLMSYLTCEQFACWFDSGVNQLCHTSGCELSHSSRFNALDAVQTDDVPAVRGRRGGVGAAHGGICDVLPLLRRHVQLLQPGRRRRRCAFGSRPMEI